MLSRFFKNRRKEKSYWTETGYSVAERLGTAFSQTPTRSASVTTVNLYPRTAFGIWGVPFIHEPFNPWLARLHSSPRDSFSIPLEFLLKTV
jgi:hypothetical protein